MNDVFRTFTDVSKLKQGVGYVFIFYFFLTVIFYLSFPEFIPEDNVIFTQLFLNLGVILGVFYGVSFKGRQIFVFIFLYQCFATLLLRQIFYLNYDSPFGYDPIDALFYHKQAYFLKDFSFSRVIYYFQQNDIDADDWGFILIQRFVYLFTDSEYWGLLLMLIFNSGIVALSSWLFYKLSNLFIIPCFSKFLVALWGFSPMAVFTAVAGLKENFFLFFIIGSFYFLYRFFQTKSFFLFLCFSFFCIGIYSFRYALAFMMVLTFLLAFFSFYKFTRKLLPYLVVVGLGICIGGFYFILSYIGESLGKAWVTTVLEYQLSQSSQSPLITMIVNVLSALLGPFPNFVGTEDKTHTFIYVIVPLLKLCFSYFYLLGIYYILRLKVWMYYPLLLFIALNSVMLIFTYFSLHLRYNWPHIPMLMIIAAFGYTEYKKRKIKPFFYHCYLIAVTGIIVVFTLRLA